MKSQVAWTQKITTEVLVTHLFSFSLILQSHIHMMMIMVIDKDNDIQTCITTQTCQPIDPLRAACGMHPHTEGTCLEHLSPLDNRWCWMKRRVVKRSPLITRYGITGLSRDNRHLWFNRLVSLNEQVSLTQIYVIHSMGLEMTFSTGDDNTDSRKSWC